MVNLCHLWHKWQRHIFTQGYDHKFALATLKQYLVNKYSILSLFAEIPCIDMCLCHLCHKWHKWHKFNNDHNSVLQIFEYFNSFLGSQLSTYSVYSTVSTCKFGGGRILILLSADCRYTPLSFTRNPINRTPFLI